MCGGGAGDVVKRATRRVEREVGRAGESTARDAARSLSNQSLGKRSVEAAGEALGAPAPEDPLGDLLKSTQGKDTTPAPERAPGPPSEEEASRLAADERRKRLRQRGLTSTIFTNPLGKSTAPTTAPRTLLGG